MVELEASLQCVGGRPSPIAWRTGATQACADWLVWLSRSPEGSGSLALPQPGRLASFAGTTLPNGVARLSTSHPRADPLDVLWQPAAIAWLLIAGEAVALVMSLNPGNDRPLLRYFGLMSLAVQWVLLSTLASLYLLRARLRRLQPQQVAYAAIGLLLSYAWLLAIAADLLLQSSSTIAASDRLGLQWRAVAIALAVGLLGLSAFHAHWRYRQSILRVKQAELEALQARVHPHFLFNTLNSAAALVHARPDDAERVLLDLGDLFRAALSESGWVPLGHELGLCQRYLAIEQQRFGDRLQTEWRIDKGMDGLSVPLLAVQPLVENAVVHGLDERTGTKSLSVEATQTATELHVCVRNAVPRAPAALPRNGHSIGLAGVRARIESVTHGTGSLATESDGTSFVARIVLPKAAMPPPDQTTTR